LVQPLERGVDDITHSRVCKSKWSHLEPGRRERLREEEGRREGGREREGPG
jgi:hypothetical protein